MAPDPVVLVVDDELQTLKYLPGILGYPCLTATSAAAARTLIERDPAAIAVVLCDQRMPGESGVAFLTWLRHHHPSCIRILCTAYADLDAAIAAVNEGAVYQFVLKPYQPQVLRTLVHAAIEHRLVQRDRDQLLAERLDLLQRQVATDRLQHLATTAATLAERLRQPLQALRIFLSQCPTVPAGDREDGHVLWSDLWELAQKDCQRTLTALAGMIEASVLPPGRFVPEVALAEVVTAALATHRDVTLSDPDSWPRIVGDRGLLQRLFSILLARLADPVLGVGPCLIDCKPDRLPGGVAGVRIHMQRNPTTVWTREQLLTLLGGADQPIDQPGLLSAYAIAFHHGGSITMTTAGIIVALPLDPSQPADGPPDPGLLARVIALPAA